MEREWLYIPEFAKAYGVHPDTIRRMIAMEALETLLRATKHSRIRIPRSELKRLGTKPEEKGNKKAHLSLVSRALRQHHGEIRSLIEEWQLELECFPIIVTEYHQKGGVADNGLPFDINIVEHKHLFTSLNEHIVNKELWNKYSILKNTFKEYVKAHDIVINKLVTIMKNWLKNWSDIQIGTDFQEPFYDIIVPLYVWEKDDLPYMSEDDRAIFTIEWKAEGDFLLASPTKRSELYTVLKASNPLSYIEHYESMCKQLIRSEEVLRLISLSKKVWKLKHVVYDLISEVLLSRNYIMHTCKLCVELSRT